MSSGPGLFFSCLFGRGNQRTHVLVGDLVAPLLEHIDFEVTLDLPNLLVVVLVLLLETLDDAFEVVLGLGDGLLFLHELSVNVADFLNGGLELGLVFELPLQFGVFGNVVLEPVHGEPEIFIQQLVFLLLSGDVLLPLP